MRSVLAVMAGSLLLAGAALAQDYKVVDGSKADPKTRRGYSVFLANCVNCHGEDALGTKVAPDLTVKMKALKRADFDKLLNDGREFLVGDIVRYMPPFKENDEVKPHFDALWSYLKARAEGGLKPGRPAALE